MHRGLHCGGTNIGTHVHVGHLAGVDFSGFSRELVRTVLGPVSDVGLDRRCSSADGRCIAAEIYFRNATSAGPLPPFSPWSPHSRKYIAMLAVCEQLRR